MAEIKNYLEYSELAQVSYLDGLESGMFDTGYIIGDKNILEKEFSPEQADNFAKRYIVAATSQQYEIGNVSGFDAVLFYDTVLNKHVLAVRGTTPYDPRDLIADIQILKDGKTYSQYLSMKSFYEKLIEDNYLMESESIYVTGHSLGGYLTQMFAATYPSNVIHAYSYNALGIGGLKQEVIEAFTGTTSVPSTKITNIIADEGWDFAAGSGMMLGDEVFVSIDQGGMTPLTKTPI